MKSTEFITEGLSKTIMGVLEDLSQIFNIDIKILTEMGMLCKQNNVKLTLIEPILNISKDCQPYLREVGIENSLALYRGVDSYSDDFKANVKLLGRTPKAMDPYLFDEINKYFKDMYGAPFRNAMLCTGDAKHASIFGNVYMVFPTGNFKFLWNPEVQDFNFSYGDFAKQLRDHGRIDGGPWDSNNVDLIGKLFLEEFIKELDWHSIDMNRATESHAEIMIRSKSYYGISLSKFKDNRELITNLLEMAE